MRAMTNLKPLMTLVALFLLASCSIEPPLRLPAQNVALDRQAVEIRVEAIWENPDWGYEFLYGWEQADVDLYGPAEYEDPKDFELRLYFLGENPDAEHTRVTPSLMRSNFYRSMFYYGYHDILMWSNIYTKDNTQSVLIDERLDEVNASVTRNSSAPALVSALQKHLAPNRAFMYNQPEIFYSAYYKNLHVTPNPDDYDYYDEQNQCYVKRCDLKGSPLVYIYLLQVVIRNNEGRIKGINSGAVVSGVSDSVNVNYGNTSRNSSSLLFDLGVKRTKVVPEGYLNQHHSGFLSQCQLNETVDVLGGRFTTYGLCGMKGYLQEPSRFYNGTEPENKNLVAIDFTFKNDRDSIITFDLGDQMKNTCHGGVLTIEVDASDIPLPTNPNGGGGGGGSGFDPYIENYGDTVMTEITM